MHLSSHMIMFQHSSFVIFFLVLLLHPAASLPPTLFEAVSVRILAMSVGDTWIGSSRAIQLIMANFGEIPYGSSVQCASTLLLDELASLYRMSLHDCRFAPLYRATAFVQQAWTIQSFLASVCQIHALVATTIACLAYLRQLGIARVGVFSRKSWISWPRGSSDSQVVRSTI
jgi:hypothetical protein